MTRPLDWADRSRILAANPVRLDLGEQEIRRLPSAGLAKEDGRGRVVQSKTIVDSIAELRAPIPVDDDDPLANGVEDRRQYISERCVHRGTAGQSGQRHG